ncbi:MAG: DUF4268 domain-containing protein [Paludibacteraceae bacterium]|nr:DUF4268 domain-containing protein [Paludibacteraceae bacterium]
MDKLGKMIKFTDLRSVWPHEANDFTKWLALEENLALLGDTIGIDLELEERESSVGSFSVDIFAKEVGSDRKVIIENQLEDTNHDHLGKLITYASGKDAEVIVWVVKRARDEHRQAIEWLNQHTDNNLGFFLLEIELWQIGDSEKAPRFNIVEKPNEWTKTMKSIDGLSNIALLKLDFWTGFNDAMAGNSDFTRNFHTRKASPHYWYNLSIGSSAYRIGLTINTQNQSIGAGIYIYDNKDIDQFKSQIDAISGLLNSEVEWREAEKSCSIVVTTNINPMKRECWAKAYSWFLEKAIVFKSIASKYGG